MPKTQDLSTFLRKEVLRNKIKGTQSTQTGESAFDRLSPCARFKKELASLFSDKNSPPNDSQTKGRYNRNSGVDDNSEDGDVFSLFKEQIKSNPKDERLSRFLTEDRKEKDLDNPQEHVTEKHIELKLLRDELASLVAYEETLSVEEKHGLRIQKATLNATIAKLEVQVNRIDTERRKVTLGSGLPPPISMGEKKRLMRAARLVGNAKAGREKLPKKRSREESDLDLDGEERLRLGKSLKRPATGYTGSWIRKGKDVSSHAGDEGILSLDAKKLLALRKAIAELEKREAAADFERVMREVVGDNED